MLLGELEQLIAVHDGLEATRSINLTVAGFEQKHPRVLVSSKEFECFRGKLDPELSVLAAALKESRAHIGGPHSPAHSGGQGKHHGT